MPCQRFLSVFYFLMNRMVFASCGLNVCCFFLFQNPHKWLPSSTPRKSRSVRLSLHVCLHEGFICLSVKLRSVGGEAAGASSLAPKVGPLGLVRCSIFESNKSVYHVRLHAPNVFSPVCQEDW